MNPIVGSYILRIETEIEDIKVRKEQITYELSKLPKELEELKLKETHAKDIRAALISMRDK